MPARHALLIGNSAFRHAELARLSAPANDVRELAALLEDPAIGGFTTELKLDIGLVDGRKAIRRLFEDRHPDDLVLFYYSGHGLLDTHGRFYLAMTETDPADPDAGSIDETWLRGVFDGSSSRRQVAILDCCHSGAFIPDGLVARDAAGGPILTEKTFDPTGQGRFIMAATTATTSAFEQDGRSLYTRHLVEGLTGGAAAPESDTVTILNLHKFVRTRVGETALSAMRPQLWQDATLNPDATHLAIARNPHPRPKLPDEEVSKLWSKDPEAIELAIFRLIEIARGKGSLAEDARRVLGERLEASDTLSYKLGARIAAFIGADEAAKALADAERRAAEAEALAAQLEQEHGTLREKFESEREQATRLEEIVKTTRVEVAETKKSLTSELEREKQISTAKAEALVAAEAHLEDSKEKLSAAEWRIEEIEQDLVATHSKTSYFRRLSSWLLLSLFAVVMFFVLSVGPGLEISLFQHQIRQFGAPQDDTAAAPEAAEEQVAASRARDGTAHSHIASLDRCTLNPVDRCPAGSWFEERTGFPEMVVIPAGRFTMGSPDTEDGRSTNEGPQQDIALARFALARSEVTFDQWEACAAAEGFCTSNRTPDDQSWGRNSRPVINVSWNDAQEFIDWLNSKVEGTPYRLPSEAEWEYAARAGERAAYPWGPDWNASRANGSNDVGRTTEMGDYPSNAFGLVDMIGNVREWTEDCWRDTLSDRPADGGAVTKDLGADCARRVVRGGSWGSAPRNLRSANRFRNDPVYRFSVLGFRPARTLTP